MTSLRFTAAELTLLLLQSAALGGILVLIVLSGATGARVMIGIATLLLMLRKVAASVRHGRLENASQESAPVSR